MYPDLPARCQAELTHASGQQATAAPVEAVPQMPVPAFDTAADAGLLDDDRLAYASYQGVSAYSSGHAAAATRAATGFGHTPEIGHASVDMATVPVVTSDEQALAAQQTDYVDGLAAVGSTAGYERADAVAAAEAHVAQLYNTMQPVSRQDAATEAE
jgi:hypothetical protein